jgi:hypothetical protein
MGLFNSFSCEIFVILSRVNVPCLVLGIEIASHGAYFYFFRDAFGSKKRAQMSSSFGPSICAEKDGIQICMPIF